MKNLFFVLGLTSLFFVGKTAQAQPANDAFANAWVLTGTSVTTNGSNVNGTKEVGEPFHAGNRGARSVWFTWTAPTNGLTRLDTFGSSFNTLLAVYTGSAVNALATIASNDNVAGQDGGVSLLQFFAVAGTDYKIAIDVFRGFGTPNGGNYILHLQMLPSVFISSPTNGTVVAAGAPLSITAQASSPNGTITRVDFFRSTGAAPQMVGSAKTAPYTIVATNSPLGTNSFFAVATDSASQVSTSGVVNVAFLNTGVTITSPSDGAILANTSPLTVSAVGFLPSGTITNVDFLVDGEIFGQDATTPFSAVWSNVTPGMHRLSAIGKDNSGASYSSASVFIGVARSLLATGSVWKYLDTGTDLGTAWVATNFDDSLWNSGPGELGYGDDVDGRPEATVVGYGPDAANKYITTYFRRTFVATNISSISNLLFNVVRDDGAVIYLNGFEAARYNMPFGTIVFSTLANNAGDDGAVFFPTNASAGLLVEGTNVLAVEIHQTLPNSSDISFDMEVFAIPVVVRNQSPVVTLNSPTNNAWFLGTADIPLQANASDNDGTVAKVEFLVDGVKVGESTTDPYVSSWTNVTIGTHLVQAVATDDQGGTGSASATITVYDQNGTPLARVTSPANVAVFDGPTNVVITASASAITGVTNIQFLANGTNIGNRALSPSPNLAVSSSLTWSNAAFGTNLVRAVAYDTQGAPGTSAVVTVIVNTPPPNTNSPVIFSVTPARDSSVTSLTTIQVVFSETVTGVDASDLLVNDVPCTSMTGSGTNYTFTVVPPSYGTVTVRWTPTHGIRDVGFPPIPFDESEPGAFWNYNYIDQTPPTIVARNPNGGATVSNLTQVSVTFSEAVTGVNAGDMLVNGTPAVGLAGGGASYTFSFAQPPAGTVNIGWAASHGITDLASTPNAFNANGAGATWSYTLDNKTVLVDSNSLWLFIKGTVEASSPIDAWRQLQFDDASWVSSLAPFYYGDPYGSAANPGTVLNDMQGGYTSIYLRKYFVISNPAAVTNLNLRVLSDDGFIAWINGSEVYRYNMAEGDIAHDGTALITSPEPFNNGAFYTNYVFDNPSYLRAGTNVLTVHAFNQSLSQSTDFGFNAQLYTYLADSTVAPPTIQSVTPAPGSLFYLTNITVRFTEPVSGVDASDLLINGAQASSVTGGNSNNVYTFTFTQPAYGSVSITWAVNHGISDFDPAPKPFDATAPGSTWQYALVNPNTPFISAQTPPAGSGVASLTQISVTFNKPVTGVNASDLLVNGVAATGLSGSSPNYTFTFAQPAYGTVSIGWAANHGITDLDVPANTFDPARPGNTWSYTLLDQVPPTIVSRVPTAGAQVTNLTQLTVTFSEPVSGVTASDLLINGTPAGGVSGGGTTYTFSFAQVGTTIINVSWAANHGIEDLATTPNAFDSTAPGATWFYTTPDNVAPTIASLDPPAFVTVRSLTQIRVTFTEPVSGLETNDLLINSQSARLLSGSGAGPYTFTFLSPSNGPVEIRWAASHGITDLANPPNAFAGGEWTYLLDPNASFEGKVVINEIMFQPISGRVADEWIELYNVTTNLINLAGWKFSRGVDFTFPNVAIAPHGYLVVAAHVGAFQTNYPTVMNVVGGWTGQLANSDKTIELETSLGEQVNSVHYASQGDWARRERGNGAALVTGITRAGSIATVSIFGHGFNNNDQVIISGANEPEYNGRFVVSGVSSGTPSTFNITVSGTPATPATGTIICRWAVDDGFSGWSWFSAAAGFGSSIELVNPNFDNTSGQNWLPSALTGTPGRANSVLSNDVAPLILDVTHFPPVPRSTDPVAITARVQDDLANGVQSVTLFYRNHTGTSPSSFTNTNMFDDGAHSDGVNHDGLYGAVVPAAANGTVIEFYVQATDTTGHTRTWPAAAMETNNTFGQIANALYQVDNEVITNTMPAIRVVLSGTERVIFPPSSRNSDAAMNLTFISADGDGTKVRYLCEARIRGAGSRSRTPPNNRIDIPTDNRWNGLSSINLNSQFVHAQLVGNNLALKSGLPTEAVRVVQYRINGINPAPISAPVNGTGNGAGWGTFVLVEPPNGDLADDLYPLDGNGNFYRASTGNHNADLNYNADPNNYLSRGYYKTSNKSVNDWTDLQKLTFAFSQVAANSDYIQAISTNLNVLEWMRYFAVGSLLNFGETALFNGIGDDYALYRGEVDKRFVVLGHDFDTVLGQGDTTGGYPINTGSSIYIMLNPPNGSANVPLLRRFMTNAPFAPFFFAELKRLCDTTFHPGNLNPFIDQLLTGWGVGPDATTIANMKNYAAARRTSVLAQIPLSLTVSNNLPVSSGYPMTTTPNVALFGTSHAIDTRKVLINGNQAGWAAWDARWTNTVTLQPGINRVVVQSLNSNDVEFARATADIWYDDGSVQALSGTLASDTVLTASGGPYNISANLTVPSGITLTIQPGTTVYLASGVNITIANGGRLLAEGTDSSRIRFTRIPGGANWGGITLNGGAASPETRIAYAYFEFNNSTAIHSSSGTLFLDHLTFGNTAVQYVSLDGSSFVVQDCNFPSATAQFELVHGTQGIKSGGRGIFVRNYFGKPIAYNDVVDFTGGNRPGPIVQFIDNVFVGSDDDILDLDSTDAWIEHNIFLHCHKNGSPDSSSAISGGADNADTSQITALGNIIFDIDQAANAKQGNFYTLLNNTIVHQNHSAGTDTNGAVALLSDVGTVEGAGMYLEGNIIYDAEKLVAGQTASIVTFTNNLMQLTWAGPGGNNINGAPVFKRLPQVSDTTNFNSWADAQVMWDWFSLRSGSPGLASGETFDKGAVPPARGYARPTRSASGLGASISGEPIGITPETSATLRIDINRTGNAIPPAGFPNGSGFSHYKWRRDGGAWSPETPITTPITLTALGNGPHYVEVVGKNDAGFYQDDPVFGADASVTVSRTWTVNTAASALRLNEILASNSGALTHNGTTPDAIELFNAGSTTVDLSGLRLSNDPTDPDKYLFPQGTSLAAGAYLILYANNPDATPGIHIGFNLNQQGDALYLYDSTINGGALIDSVEFGLQITDLSIGRIADGSWALNQPTFGAANAPTPLGDPRALRINEWLAIAEPPLGSDFIELYNSDSLPVALGGLYLSDEILGWLDRHQIAALSFMPGFSYQRFLADGDQDQSAEHLNFTLSGDQGNIGLYLTDLTAIDCVTYQAQRANVAQGRSPNGTSTIVFLSTPTPGAPNPLVTINPFGGALVINEVLANNSSLPETVVGTNIVTPDWIEIYNGSTNVIDLTNFSLTDDTVQPRRFVFTNATPIAAGGYRRIFFEAGQPATNNNTGFGLKSTGGSVYLFDSPTNGGSLLSLITYGLQTPNLSIGRVPDGSTNWFLTSPTPQAANVAVPSLGDPANLRVNEWMADPSSGADWLEIYNPNSLPVALGGLHLTDDLGDRLKHTINPLSFIGTGTNAWQKFIADGNNTAAGADHVGFSLKAGGEDVGIATANGTLIDGYSFGQQTPGVSEGRFPDGSTNVITFPGTDSPGASNYRLLTDVVINEALTHTDDPLEDAIELRNLTGQEIDISGWWLSDDPGGTLQKYQIPANTRLAPYGFAVIYETHFTNRVEAAIPFALSSHGDEVVLCTASNNVLTGYRTSVKFGAADNGVSFGRYVTSVGAEEFVAMSTHTFGVDDPGSVEEFRLGTGATNAYPKIGPVVISEIMYHPPDLAGADNGRDEFIELHNITTVPVALYDGAYPSNVWHLRDAVDFNFPPGTIIPAGGYLLAVSFDPVNDLGALAAFRNTYHLDQSVPVVGPYQGKLANSDEDIELRKPGTPDADGVPYILVEHVHYADNVPWPANADGTGLSLQRSDVTQFGNDPANWTAATPTPGPQGSNFDSDNDLMPDAWEIAHGLDPYDDSDAGLDIDGDGLTNLQEYQRGTDPRDARSGLHFSSITLSGGQVVLTFFAGKNQSYIVEYTDALGSGDWHDLNTYSAVATNRVITFSVSKSQPARFFRLKIPTSAATQLQINSIQAISSSQVTLTFTVPANLNCTIESASNPAGPSWSALQNYSAVTTNRVIQQTLPASNPSFYRLRSP